MNSEARTSDPLVQTLTVPGALLVADSTVLDPGDMKIIALKVLAHEYRKLRKRCEDMARDHREDMRAAVAEERRSIETGEPYGTY